jgi:predicted small metal-binding protein
MPLKKIACRDVIPDCPFTATAATEEELLKHVAAHAEHAHGLATVPPEVLATVKRAIRTSEG